MSAILELDRSDDFAIDGDFLLENTLERGTRLYVVVIVRKRAKMRNATVGGGFGQNQEHDDRKCLRSRNMPERGTRR